MSKKTLRMKMEFSSIFHDSKWLVEVKVSDFSCNAITANELFVDKVKAAVDEYNSRRICKYKDCSNYSPNTKTYCCNACSFDDYDSKR